jgi:prepilin peptidase dependent protein B
MLSNRSRRLARQRGLSMVEMMVGITVGLFLVAGATTVFVTHLTNSRQLLVEARVNQDLRATVDLISRDLRRAGYWENALSGATASAAGTTVANPYSAITPTGTTQVEYLFARNADNTLDNNEQFGFRRAVDGATGRGVIQMKTDSATWQTVTDPTVLDVPAGNQGLTVTQTATVIPVGGACAKVCPPPAGATWTCPNPPTLTLRQYDITLRAVAVADPRIIRTLQSRARVRNDQPAGVCPA